MQQSGLTWCIHWEHGHANVDAIHIGPILGSILDMQMLMRDNAMGSEKIWHLLYFMYCTKIEHIYECPHTFGMGRFNF